MALAETETSRTRVSGISLFNSQPKFRRYLIDLDHVTGGAWPIETGSKRDAVDADEGVVILDRALLQQALSDRENQSRARMFAIRQASAFKYVAVAIAVLIALLPIQYGLAHSFAASFISLPVAMMVVRTSSNEAIAALRGSNKQDEPSA